jgi:exodeoxyribonuclease V gamma subunit
MHPNGSSAMSLLAHFSNQLEALFDALCQQLAAAPAGPFDDEVLIVPSAALQRWLTWRVAEQRGIAAQLDFHYLAPWLMQQLRQGGEPEPLDAAAWPWRVYELLAHPRLLREHPRLAHSLGDPAAPTAERLRWERAVAIAARLEGLGLERPDWLAAWRERRLLLAHPDEAWMAALWRAVGDDSADRLARQLPRLRSAPGGRPVHLFAPARLAPLHLQALAALGDARDIHLYVLNPCREYWFDLLSPRRLARLQSLGRADASHETLHPLLAHWAAPSQQLLRQLAALEWHADGGDYREPLRPTLLAEVQRSLLDLGPMPQGPLRAGDRSLELHRCHSLRRQLEVLHDRLLDLFSSDPSLQLGDVLVLLPELDAAAPLIDAVFGSAPAPLALPYSLSGQTRPPLPPRVDAFVRVLALLQGPAPAGEVWALCSAFGLEEDDEDGAAREQALQSAGHHAGLGQARAAAQGLSAAHSLEAALQRLLLAHCLPDAPRQMPLGRWRAAPQRLAAGELAALQGFARTLIAAEGAAAQPQPAARWCAWLQALVQALLPDTGDPDGAPAEAARQLREAIAKLDAAWSTARLTQPLPLARVHAALLDALHDPARGGVAGGAISFSTLAGLRALPARVVAVLGMDDGAWPRAHPTDPIDLLAAQPRSGDRDPRAEQRQQFLDALLAAREHFFLGATCCHARDGSALPPAALVTELLEALGPELARAVSVDQPLQPFSPLAFDPTDPRRQSFRAEWLPPQGAPGSSVPAADDTDPLDADPLDDAALEDEAAEADGGRPEPAFLAAPLMPLPAPTPLAPLDPPAEVALDALLEALRHPARAWLRRRLDLRLPWDEAPWQEAEPFALDPRDLQAWADEAAALLAEDGAAAAALAASDPRWPGGALGAAHQRQEASALQRHAALLHDWHAAPPLPAQPLDIALQLQGRACRLRFDSLALRRFEGRASALRARYARCGAADRLQTWALHLALQAALGPEARALALHRGMAPLRFAPVAEPLAPLQTLLELALAWRDEPPPLPLKTAWTWVVDGERKAWAAWRGGRYPERSEAVWQLLTRGAARPEPPADARFAELAAAVFAPLREHQL